MRKHILTVACIVVAISLAGCSRTASTGENTQRQVSITVSGDGAFSVAGKQCQPEELTSKLRQMVASGATNAIVQNVGVSSNQFMAMIQACDVAGFRRITLATAGQQR